jgi:hypothetical protein
VLRRTFEPKIVEVTEEWRKFHNEELHNLSSFQGIIRVTQLRRMRCASHVARMGKKRNAYRILMENPEGNRPPRRTRSRWEVKY